MFENISNEEIIANELQKLPKWVKLEFSGHTGWSLDISGSAFDLICPPHSTEI